MTQLTARTEAWRQAGALTEAVLQAVLSLRPNTKVTRLRGLGHYPQIEDPDAVYQVIQQHASS